MEQSAIQQQALANARNGQSFSNYAAILEGFKAKGIPEQDILPRENVFTFHAWKALGRQVRKGEHGIKVCTYVPMDKVTEDNGERKVECWKAPRMTTVFHVSQTDPIDRKAESKPHPSFTGNTAKQQPQSYYSDEFTPIA